MKYKSQGEILFFEKFKFLYAKQDTEVNYSKTPLILSKLKQGFSHLVFVLMMFIVSVPNLQRHNLFF